MPTAYLSASQLKELTDVSVNPGAEQDGYPLVWNQTAGKWQAKDISQGNINLVNGGITFANASGAPSTNQSYIAVGTGSTPPCPFFVKGAFAPSYGQFAVEGNTQDPRAGFGLFGPGGTPRYVFFAGSTSATTMFAMTEMFTILSQRPSPNTSIFTSYSFSPQGTLSITNAVSSTSTTTGNLVVPGGIGVGENVTIGGYLRMANSSTPASASASGLVGQMAWDSNYFYICTASNTWKRTALSAW